MTTTLTLSGGSEETLLSALERFARDLGVEIEEETGGAKRPYVLEALHMELARVRELTSKVEAAREAAMNEIPF